MIRLVLIFILIAALVVLVRPYIPTFVLYATGSGQVTFQGDGQFSVHALGHGQTRVYDHPITLTLPEGNYLLGCPGGSGLHLGLTIMSPTYLQGPGSVTWFPVEPGSSTSFDCIPGSLNR